MRGADRLARLGSVVYPIGPEPSIRGPLFNGGYNHERAPKQGVRKIMARSPGKKNHIKKSRSLELRRPNCGFSLYKGSPKPTRNIRNRSECFAKIKFRVTCDGENRVKAHTNASANMDLSSDEEEAILFLALEDEENGRRKEENGSIKLIWSVKISESSTD
ncbi:hypothetical protein NQ318_012539 [Aromia moschata]|uniref:Uncharacterized protein n=1 Tax=Aromia moschata TaxID=1265417 RepID=A0AAV8XFV1_9CUCU|nr:hypothetical protein NQ318_012539 [Aromia moschata]